MTNFLIKKFVKNHEDIDNNRVRASYGVMVSTVGIIVNICLFVVKLFVGIMVTSVAIMADSVNNLSDAASAVITILGFKLANKPADKEHPFGHGRIEYVSALIISFIILLIGYEFMKSSIEKIITPQAVKFDIGSVTILIIMVFAKIWLSAINKKIGKLIHSEACLATAQDSINDVYVTLATIISLVFTHFTGIMIDGFIGALVALILLYSGYQIAGDVLSNLLGKSVSKEYAQKIKRKVESYEGIKGTHDLIVHNYGPTSSMATIHAEVPSDWSIEKAHKIIDTCELEVGEILGMQLVIHMDPIDTNDKRLPGIVEAVNQYIANSKHAVEAHDFRIVEAEGHINVVFELVVGHDCNTEQYKTMQNDLQGLLKSMNEKYRGIVSIESSYIDS